MVGPLYGFFSRGPKSLAPPLVVVVGAASLRGPYCPPLLLLLRNANG